MPGAKSMSSIFTSAHAVIAAVGCACVFSTSVLAQTSIIPVGSSLTFGGGNAPDTYSAITTFSSTPVLVDNGAVKIWQTQVATGTSGEWDVFYMQTVNGGPLAGNTSGNWNIVMDYDLSQPAIFDAVVNQWLVNGTPVNPLTNGIGSICCATASNPILPGSAYYNAGFSGMLAAGVQSNWQQIFVNPYNFVSSGGVNPATANEFIFALHFTLQSAPTFTTALAAGYQVEPFAPEAIVSAFGTNMSDATAPATEVPLPTTLGGTSLMVTDSAGVTRPAALYYVSPAQINYEIPLGTAPGAAEILLTPQSGITQTETIQIGTISPGLFALNPTGLVGAYVLPVISGVQQPLQPVYQINGADLVPLPINLGPAAQQIYLILFGTGLRNASNVTVTVGGTIVPVLFFGPAPGNVGEDQVNIGPLPTSLAGQGNVNIVLTADTMTANTVNVTIQ
jgi:uncharacterized protein (TIGR03437 family)